MAQCCYGLRVGADQQAIVPAMIMALKFEYLALARDTTGHAYGSHTGFGSGIGKPNLVDMGQHIYH